MAQPTDAQPVRQGTIACIKPIAKSADSDFSALGAVMHMP